MLVSADDSTLPGFAGVQPQRVEAGEYFVLHYVSNARALEVRAQHAERARRAVEGRSRVAPPMKLGLDANHGFGQGIVSLSPRRCAAITVQGANERCSRAFTQTCQSSVGAPLASAATTWAACQAPQTVLVR